MGRKANAQNVFTCSALEARTLLSQAYAAVLSLPAATGPAFDVGLTSYSFGAQRLISNIGPSTNVGPASYSEATAFADVSTASPQLFSTLVSGQMFSTAKLTFYENGLPTVQEQLSTVYILGDSPTDSAGKAPEEELSILFKTMTETTTLPNPTIATSNGSEVLSFTPTGSTAKSIQLSSADWNIKQTITNLNTGIGTGKAQLSTFNASESAFAPASITLLTELLAADDITLATLTIYGAGGVPALTCSMQDAYVVSTSTSMDSSSGPADSFSLAFGSVTMDYAPTGTTASVATWDAETNSAVPVAKSPAPPTGVLRANGGSPGLTTSTPEELDMGTTPSNGISFAGIIVDSSSVSVVQSGTRATAPIVQIEAPLGSDSVDWLSAVGYGSSFTTATMVFRENQPGGGYFNYHEIQLSTVLASSFELQSTSTGVKEIINLTGTVMLESYTPQSTNGTAQMPIVRSWNFSSSAEGINDSGSPTATVVPTSGDAVLTLPNGNSNSTFQLPLTTFTFEAQSNAAYERSGVTSTLSLSTDFSVNPFSPVLFLMLVNDQSLGSTATVTVYNFQGTATATFQLTQAHLATDSQTTDVTTGAAEQNLTFTFSSINETFASQASATSQPNSETVQFTVPGASSTTTILDSGSSWQLGDSAGGNNTKLSAFNASSTSPAAIGSLATAINAMDNLALVTVTEFNSANAAVESLFIQDAYVDLYNLSYTSAGITVTYDLTVASATVDYSPATGSSIATVNAQGGLQALPTTPVPPTGTTVANGSSPGISSTAAAELTLTGPIQKPSVVGIGAIQVLGFSYTLGAPFTAGSPGHAAAPIFTIDAVLGSDAPDWLVDVAAGGSFNSAVITLRNSAGVTTSQYTLGEAVLSSFGMSTVGSGAAGTVEQITFVSEKLTVSYDPPTLAAVVSQNWDFQANATFTSSTGSVLESLAGPDDYLRFDSSSSSLDVWYATTDNGTPDFTVPISQLSLLTLAPTEDVNAVITVDYSNGNPLATAGLAVDGLRGVGSLSLLVIGTPAVDTINVNGTSVGVNAAFGSSTITYLGLSEITLNGDGGADTFIQSAQPGAALQLAGNTSASQLEVNAGTFTFPAPAAGSGATVDTLNQLTVGSGAKVVLATASAHTDRTLLKLNVLSDSGTVDIGGNDLDIPSGNLTTITALVRSGFANGTWAGTGIISSTAAADTTHLSTIGAIENAQGGSPVFTTGKLFDGIVPGNSDVLVRYTYYGDANLDGHVDGSDYTLIDHGFTAHLTGWYNGDFNYDGSTNGSDYTLVDNAFNTQGVSLASQIVTALAMKTSSPDAAKANPIFSNAPVTLGDPWQLQSSTAAAGFLTDTPDALTDLTSR